MFILLTRILLWALIGTIVWYVFTKFIPRPYLTWLGGIIVFAFVILAFLEPNNATIGTIWNILSFPLKPLGLSIFLLLSSLKDGVKKVAGNFVLAGVLILLISSMPIVAFWLTGQIERSVNSTALFQENLPTSEAVRAVVVIGDGTNAADPLLRSRAQISNVEAGLTNVFTSRLLYAAQVYQARAPQNSNLLLIVSAGPRVGDQNQANQQISEQAIRTLLVGAGVPGDRIIIDTQGTDIYSSVTQVRQILQDQGFDPATESIVLVAPAISISRTISTLSNSTLSNFGIRVIPKPTDRFVFQVQNGGRLLASLADLVPNVDALVLTTRLVEELLSSVYYFLRGWIGGSVIF